MADTVLKLQAGDLFKVDHGGAATAATAGLYVAGTQVVGPQFGTAIPNYTLTFSANAPTVSTTAGTIADGTSTGATNTESAQVLADVWNKVNLIIDALSGHGLISES